MAIYHLSVKTVSRGKGQSAVAKAAYNSRENIRDERTGEVKNYTRRAGLLFSGIFAPKDAPEWATDRAAVWNAVERREDESKRRAAAQLAREITIALPHELTDKQRQQLVTDFVREQFMRRGMIADVSIHAPATKGDQRNHHAHILLTMREIGPEGFGEKQREWNSREQMTKWRDAWERLQNRYLERYGHTSRVDQRSLEAQGIEREPTTHLGPQAHAMEKEKGVETERGKIHRESFDAAKETARLKRELAQVNAQLREAERQPRAAKTAQASAFRDGERATVQRPPRKTPANDNRVVAKAGAVLNRGGKGVVNVGSAVLSTFSKAFESLFTPPPKPLTRAQIEEQNKRGENAVRDQQAAASRNYLRAAQQERIDNASRERADADRQRDSENWRKQQQDRGGRER
jgi:MobA/MobL family